MNKVLIGILIVIVIIVIYIYQGTPTGFWFVDTEFAADANLEYMFLMIFDDRVYMCIKPIDDDDMFIESDFSYCPFRKRLILTDLEDCESSDAFPSRLQVKIASTGNGKMMYLTSARTDQVYFAGWLDPEINNYMDIL